MTERKSPHNQTTIPVLDQHGLPLAPARPSRVRQWLESGRATKVWIKGIFAVQLHDLNADTAITGNFALNMDPGHTTGIAIHANLPTANAAPSSAPTNTSTATRKSITTWTAAGTAAAPAGADYAAGRPGSTTAPTPAPKAGCHPASKAW